MAAHEVLEYYTRRGELSRVPHTHMTQIERADRLVVQKILIHPGSMSSRLRRRYFGRCHYSGRPGLNYTG